MSGTFLLDQPRGHHVTYEEFLGDLRSAKLRPRYVRSTEPLTIFRSLALCMVHGGEVELLDGDLSLGELERIGVNADKIAGYERLSTIDLPSFNAVFERARSQPWTLVIYTSGTTGRPKRAIHNFESLTRNLRTGERHARDVWGSAYNPTHFAGLQVFFQAFFNRNPIVNVFDAARDIVRDLLTRNRVSHLSATPTFYRAVLPYFCEPLRSIIRVTCGGERFDESLRRDLARTFPEAKILNIYASTEVGSILQAEGETFKVIESLRDRVRFAEDGEMLIHASLFVGEERPFSGEWYPTGDLVEFRESMGFVFKSRKSELINVGGYKVNPNEVEALLIGHPLVLDCSVFARENRITGNILAADVVLKEKVEAAVVKRELQAYARAHLQDWKVPRIINCVEALALTRTGKKARACETPS